MSVEKERCIDLGVSEGGVTFVLIRMPVILVIYCAFLRGSHGPDLYSSILVRHSFVNLDSCSFIWDDSVPLIEESASPCIVMNPANT